MRPTDILKQVRKFGTITVDHGILRIEAKEPLPSELLGQIKQVKAEILKLLQEQPLIDLDYCRDKHCNHLINHVANPRCLHPLATENGRYPSGCWLGYLISCPEQTNQLQWKH